MHSQPFARPRILAAGAALALLLLAAGCASDDDQPRPPHGAAGKPRHFPTLAGQETFFNGAITADVLVGAMTGFDTKGDEGGSPGDGGHHHGGGMHMGGGGGGGGHRHGGGGGGEGGPGGPGGEGGGSSDPEAGGNGAMRRADAMGSPPVMIHLRFTNHGSAHADLVIDDFLSPLGNFAVQPEKLGLDPDQSVEVEPMASRLAGEITGGEITLTLKLGAAKETKTIALALKPEPAPTPSAPPAASEPAK